MDDQVFLDAERTEWAPITMTRKKISVPVTDMPAVINIDEELKLNSEGDNISDQAIQDLETDDHANHEANDADDELSKNAASNIYPERSVFGIDTDSEKFKNDVTEEPEDEGNYLLPDGSKSRESMVATQSMVADDEGVKHLNTEIDVVFSNDDDGKVKGLSEKLKQQAVEIPYLGNDDMLLVNPEEDGDSRKLGDDAHGMQQDEPDSMESFFVISEGAEDDQTIDEKKLKVIQVNEDTDLDTSKERIIESLSDMDDERVEMDVIGDAEHTAIPTMYEVLEGQKEDAPESLESEEAISMESYFVDPDAGDKKHAKEHTHRDAVSPETQSLGNDEREGTDADLQIDKFLSYPDTDQNEASTHTGEDKTPFGEDTPPQFPKNDNGMHVLYDAEEANKGSNAERALEHPESDQTNVKAYLSVNREGDSRHVLHDADETLEETQKDFDQSGAETNLCTEETKVNQHPDINGEVIGLQSPAEGKGGEGYLDLKIHPDSSEGQGATDSYVDITESLIHPILDKRVAVKYADKDEAQYNINPYAEDPDQDVDPSGEGSHAGTDESIGIHLHAGQKANQAETNQEGDEGRSGKHPCLAEKYVGTLRSLDEATSGTQPGKKTQSGKGTHLDKYGTEKYPGKDDDETHADKDKAGTHPDKDKAGTHLDKNKSGTHPDKDKAGTHPGKNKTGSHPDKDKAGTHPDKDKAGTHLDKNKSGTHPDKDKAEAHPDKDEPGTQVYYPDLYRERSKHPDSGAEPSGLHTGSDEIQIGMPLDINTTELEVYENTDERRTERQPLGLVQSELEGSQTHDKHPQRHSPIPADTQFSPELYGKVAISIEDTQPSIHAPSYNIHENTEFFAKLLILQNTDQPQQDIQDAKAITLQEVNSQEFVPQEKEDTSMKLGDENWTSLTDKDPTEFSDPNNDPHNKRGNISPAIVNEHGLANIRQSAGNQSDQFADMRSGYPKYLINRNQPAGHIGVQLDEYNKTKPSADKGRLTDKHRNVESDVLPFVEKPTIESGTQRNSASQLGFVNQSFTDDWDLGPWTAAEKEKRKHPTIADNERDRQPKSRDNDELNYLDLGPWTSAETDEGKHPTADNQWDRQPTSRVNDELNHPQFPLDQMGNAPPVVDTIELPIGGPQPSGGRVPISEGDTRRPPKPPHSFPQEPVVQKPQAVVVAQPIGIPSTVTGEDRTASRQSLTDSDSLIPRNENRDGWSTGLFACLPNFCDGIYNILRIFYFAIINNIVYSMLFFLITVLVSVTFRFSNGLPF